MRLYVEPMDAVLVEFDEQGRVRFENEDWAAPSLQETRAILHAAGTEAEALRELVETLEAALAPSDGTPGAAATVKPRPPSA